jgi:hypothetical protein
MATFQLCSGQLHGMQCRVSVHIDPHEACASHHGCDSSAGVRVQVLSMRQRIVAFQPATPRQQVQLLHTVNHAV